MGERGIQLKADVNKKGWEESDFPIVCETCLGDNPYVRMTKEPHGKACKICERPYTVFRWKAGTQGRIKSTQLCQTCAKLKNACQTCVLDLQYGLPLEVRDKFLSEEEKIDVPQSDANREYLTQTHEKQLALSGNPYASKPLNPKLLRMARSTPYYKRNMPHKCSFYAKGECNRGSKCPFLHDMPTDKMDPLAHQNIRDRFYGQDDPVAAKMMARANELPQLEPPEDEGICSLWVGNLSEQVTQEDLRDTFYSFGELQSINIVPGKDFAFVRFTTRAAAEAAAQHHYKTLMIKGRLLKLNWATRSEESGTALTHGSGSQDTRHSSTKSSEAGSSGKGQGKADNGSKDNGSESSGGRTAPGPVPYQPRPLPPVPGLPPGAPVAPAGHLPPMPYLQAYQPPPPGYLVTAPGTSVHQAPAAGSQQPVIYSAVQPQGDYRPPPPPPRVSSYGPILHGQQAPRSAPPPPPPPQPYYASMDPHRLGAAPQSVAAAPAAPELSPPPVLAGTAGGSGGGGGGGQGGNG